MSATHRRQEVAELLPQSRQMCQTLIETVAAGKIIMAKLQLFSGVDVYDFEPNYDTATAEEKAIAEARRDETAVAISAVTSLLTALAQPNKLKPQVTDEQAILIIAKR